MLLNGSHPKNKNILSRNVDWGWGAKKIFLIVPTDFKVILSIDVIPQIYSGGGIYIQYTHTKHFVNY